MVLLTKRRSQEEKLQIQYLLELGNFILESVVEVVIVVEDNAEIVFCLKTCNHLSFVHVCKE